MTPALNQQLHGLLTRAGLNHQKAVLVSSYTGGRSESSKDLTDTEAKAMIGYLASVTNQNDAGADKMRKRILSMAHEMHWHIAGSQKIDIERVNDWCCVFGYGKKILNRYSYAELPKLVTQFEFVYKDYLSKLSSPKN